MGAAKGKLCEQFQSFKIRQHNPHVYCFLVTSETSRSIEANAKVHIASGSLTSPRLSICFYSFVSLSRIVMYFLLFFSFIFMFFLQISIYLIHFITKLIVKFENKWTIESFFLYIISDLVFIIGSILSLYAFILSK